MRRYFKILTVLIRYNFTQQTAYRPSFIFAIVGKLLRFVLFVVFADAIFRNVPQILGWNLVSIRLLIFTLFVVEFLIGVTFHRNLLFFFPRWLDNGEYDYMIIRPLNPIFFTAFRVLDFFDLFSLIALLGAGIWYGIASAIGGTTMIGYFALLTAAYFILFSFALLLSSINFWTLIPTGLGRLYESIGRLNRFPLDVLPKFWRVALFYVVPVAVAGNIPAKFLIGTWSWAQLLYIVAFAIILFIVAVKFWYFALKRYSSAA